MSKILFAFLLVVICLSSKESEASPKYCEGYDMLGRKITCKWGPCKPVPVSAAVKLYKTDCVKGKGIVCECNCHAPLCSIKLKERNTCGPMNCPYSEKCDETRKFGCILESPANGVINK